MEGGTWRSHGNQQRDGRCQRAAAGSGQIRRAAPGREGCGACGRGDEGRVGRHRSPGWRLRGAYEGRVPMDRCPLRFQQPPAAALQRLGRFGDLWGEAPMSRMVVPGTCWCRGRRPQRCSRRPGWGRRCGSDPDTCWSPGTARAARLPRPGPARRTHDCAPISRFGSFRAHVNEVRRPPSFVDVRGSEPGLSILPTGFPQVPSEGGAEWCRQAGDGRRLRRRSEAPIVRRSSLPA